MGFTFSHPALIIPFKYLPRKWYSVTGLIAGSMIPDLEYFIRLSNESFYSHTFYGLFIFDIPCGILTALIYHQLIKKTLINNLPHFLKERFSIYEEINWIYYLKENYIQVISSILIGSISHVFWDSFTTITGYFIVLNPLLSSKFEIFNLQIPVFIIIKYMSSLIGAFIIIKHLKLYRKREMSNSTPANKYYWVVLIIISLIIIIVRLLISLSPISFNPFVKIIISSGLISLLITSLTFRKSLL